MSTEILQCPYLAYMTVGDFKADVHAGKFAIELDARPEASEHLFALLNDPVNEQRLVDAEYSTRALAALEAVAQMRNEHEQDESGYDLMEALAETRRAEGRPF